MVELAMKVLKAIFIKAFTLIIYFLSYLILTNLLPILQFKNNFMLLLFAFKHNLEYYFNWKANFIII